MKVRTGLYAAFAAAASTAAVSDFAVAQSSALLEEVVVSARRYEERITDAPLAVAVMDNDFLETNRVDSIQDVLELTPGADWGQFAKAQPGLTLRGINGGNFGNSSLESAVQTVYDGIPATKAFMMTGPIFDLQRVEIMRGPQGTTFGRNATLGLMHFIAARPSQEFESGVDLSVGTLDLVGSSGFISGGLNDTVSGRLAFKFQDTGGVMEERTTGKAIEDSQQLAIRGSLLIEPSDTFSAWLKAEFVSDDELPTVRRGTECVSPWLNVGGFGGYTDDCDPWKADIDDTITNRGVERDMGFLTAELVWDLNNDLSLTWLSGYQDGEHHSVQDAFGTPFAIRDQLVDNDATVLSTEVRIDNFASGNSVRWLVGATMLEDEEDRFERNIGFPERGLPNGLCGPQLNVPNGCPEWVLDTTSNTQTSSFGLFGEVQFDLSDQLTLALGGRYSDDSRDYTFATDAWGEQSGIQAIGLGNGARDCNANTIPDPLGRTNSMGMVFGVCGSATNPMGFADVVSRSWDDFSGKISLSYALNDNNTLYGLYSEGFKAGGFQHDARNQAHLRDNFVDSEGVENLEFGWKGSYDRVLFAVTLFDMEQTNAQENVNIPTGTGNVTLILNTGGIDVTGIEFEYTWAATENFTVGGNIASYDAKYLPGSFEGAEFNATTGMFIGEDISGTEPSGTVPFSLAIYGDYHWDLNNGSSIRLRADLYHRDNVWAANGVANRDGLNIAGTAPMYLRPQIDRVGLNLAWTNAADTLTLSLWGRNLNDEADYINFGPGIGSIYNLGQPGPQGFSVRSRPVGTTGRSQAGITAAFRF